MAIEYLPVSWQTYHAHAQALAEEILNDGPIDEIVAISRGGLSLGHILSDLLQIPISTFTIQSYEDIQQQGEVKITAGLQTTIEGKRIVIVDDVADTGKTLVRAIEHIKDFKPTRTITATMFYKPHSVYKPDFFVEETSKWILFPTEVVETISSMFTRMRKDGSTDAQIESLLHSLGYSPAQIAFVKKFHLK